VQTKRESTILFGNNFHAPFAHNNALSLTLSGLQGFKQGRCIMKKIGYKAAMKLYGRMKSGFCSATKKLISFGNHLGL